MFKCLCLTSDWFSWPNTSLSCNKVSSKILEEGSVKNPLLVRNLYQSFTTIGLDPVSRGCPSPKIYNESLQLNRLIHSTSLGQSQLLRYSIVSVSCVSLTGERRVELGPVSNMSTIVSWRRRVRLESVTTLLAHRDQLCSGTQAVNMWVI